MRQPRFQVYEDQSGQYRWRLLAANGRTIADGSEAYTRKADAERAVRTTIETTVKAWSAPLGEKIRREIEATGQYVVFPRAD